MNLLVFAVALVSASFIISTLTFGEQYRVIVNIGLSAMEVFGTLIAVFLGAGLVAGDVERRTVYPIVAKPVSRAQYVAGRYAGLVATTTLNLAVMAVVLRRRARRLPRRARVPRARRPLLATLGGIALQFAMIAAVAVLFSTLHHRDPLRDLHALARRRGTPRERPRPLLVEAGRRGGVDREGALRRRAEPRGAELQGGDGLQGRAAARADRDGVRLRHPVRGRRRGVAAAMFSRRDLR